MKQMFVVMFLVSVVLPAIAEEKSQAAAGVSLAQNFASGSPSGYNNIRPSETESGSTMVVMPIIIPPELQGKPAAKPTLPETLSGRWYSPSGQYSNTISLKKINGKWLMAWWKLYPTACGVEDAPVTVTGDASGGVEISLKDYQCFVSLDMKLTKVGSEFKGPVEVESVGAGKVRANVVLR